MLNVVVVHATHIAGSEVTYEIVRPGVVGGSFTFNIKVTIYRDVYQGGNVGNIPFDLGIDLAIYERNGSAWELDDQRNIYEGIPIVRPDKIPLNLQGNDCFDESVLPVFSTDKSFYILENITLDVIDTEYRIAAQRCCRSAAINNIISPDETGLVFEVIISPEAQLLQNSSPVFDFDPENVICVGFPQVIAMAATDADGDDLVYSFTTPLVAGGSRGDAVTNPCPASDPMQFCTAECDGIIPSVRNCRPDLFTTVQYQPGFSFDNPVTADQPFAINPSTGLISGTASAQGVYVIGVLVEEFRGGVKIGEVTRDFNLNVTTCNQEAVIGPPGSAGQIDNLKLQCNDASMMIIDEWDPCGAAVVRIENFANANPDRVSFRWTIYEEDGLTEVLRNEADWEPAFDLPVGRYIARLTLFPGLVCEDFCEMQLNVTAPLISDFTLDIGNAGAQCEAQPIAITAPAEDPNASYSWDFGDGSTSTQIDPGQVSYAMPGQYEIMLAVERGRCTDTTFSGPIDYFPLPSGIRALPSQFEACGEMVIAFENLSLTDAAPYMLQWNFGDGTTSTDLNAEHIYTSAGEFQVTLDISSGTGCSRTEEFPWTITILETPTAAFVATPEELTSPGQEVEFTNSSTAASSYEWRFGDGTPPAFNEDISHTFENPGVFNVQLLAFSPINSCVDTASIEIPVTAAGRPLFPNAFMPLNGRSSEFKPISVFDNFVSYRLAIFDRWGAQVFETTDFEQGWNGKKDNVGIDLPNGVYIYQYMYEVIVGSRMEEGGDSGTVMLLR